MVHGQLVGDSKDFFITKKKDILDAEPSEHNVGSDPHRVEVLLVIVLFQNRFERYEHSCPSAFVRLSATPFLYQWTFDKTMKIFPDDMTEFTGQISARLFLLKLLF